MSNKIRNILLGVVSFVAIFISAIFSGLYVIDKFLDHHEEQLYSDNVITSIHDQFNVSNALATIELLDNNDTEGLYYNSCRTLIAFTKYIDPEKYAHAPGRQEELIKMISISNETIKSLNEKGYCPDITHNNSLHPTAKPGG